MMGLIGKKVGMTQIFDEWGRRIPVTVVDVAGNMVIQSFPEQWIKIVGKGVKKVHFKDFKRQGYEWTPLLEGDVDFAACMVELRKIGYDDALLSEVSPGIAPIEDTAAAIRQIMEM